MYNILIVCTANICRSPAAEFMLRKELDAVNVTIESAGVAAVDGLPIDGVIEKLMLKNGYQNIQAHRSQSLLPSKLFKSNLILCMERSHMEYIKRSSVTSVGKCMLFSHWDGMNDVRDPFGESVEIYEKALHQMLAYSKQWASKLMNIGVFA